MPMIETKNRYIFILLGGFYIAFPSLGIVAEPERPTPSSLLPFSSSFDSSFLFVPESRLAK